MQSATFGFPAKLRPAAAGIALALCACSSPATSPQPFGSTPVALHAPSGVAHPDRGPSWIAPDAQLHDLLYVSDTGGDALDIYAYPGGGKSGEITNLADPEGLCTDSTGAVWAVLQKNFSVAKFGHAGKKRLATLKTGSAQRLIDCSVDPTTGNLAVTDAGGAAGSGAVFIWTGAHGQAKMYQNGQMLEAFFCAYDSNGDLFVDGLDSNYAFLLLEMPAGASKFQAITVNPAITFPGGMRWDGQYLAIVDQAYQNGHKSAIDRVAVSGSAGTIAQTGVLDKSCDVLGFALDGGTVVAADACGNNARFFKYPAGGRFSKSLSGFQYPVSAVVSKASP